MTRHRYIALGLDQASNTPDEFAAMIRSEQDRYETIIKNANIRIQN